jgi:acyl carrier protein
MNKEEITTVIIEVINQIQETSGEDAIDISEDTIPIGDLPDFDSLRGIETLVIIAAKLDIEIGGDVNLFISKDERRALSINDIADRIIEEVI